MKKNKVIIHVIHSPDLASLIRNHSNFSIIQTKVIIRALKKFDLFAFISFVLFLYTMTFFMFSNTHCQNKDFNSEIKKFLILVFLIMTNIGTAMPQKYRPITSVNKDSLCSAKSPLNFICPDTRNNTNVIS